MNNDNTTRQQILAHEQLDRTQLLNTMMYLRTTIEQKNTYITTLEAELASMTAQRDAWKTTACAYALEQAPELKPVEQGWELREVTPDGTTKSIDWNEFNQWIAGTDESEGE